MEDPRWLRLITIGLVLAALAVGYFLISGRFFSATPVTRTPAPVSQSVPIATSSATPGPSVLGQNTGNTSRPVAAVASPTPASAYDRIASRAQTGTGAQTLPRTGFPVGLMVVLSISVIISGWGLRRFPH